MTRIICRASHFALTLSFAFVLLAAGFASCGRHAELLERAQSARDSGDYALAAQCYEEFLKGHPHHSEAATARFGVANIYYYNLKSHERAIQHYIHLIEDFPKSADVTASRLRMAECYAALGKRKEAINEYESLVNSQDPQIQRRRIRLNIAELYYDLNDFGQALAEYEKVTGGADYDELSERAWLRIGGMRLLRDEFEEAVSAYQNVVTVTRDPSIRRQARLGMADCYRRTFQYENAIKVLEQTEPDSAAPDSLTRRIAAIREEQRQRNFSMTQSARP